MNNTDATVFSSDVTSYEKKSVEEIIELSKSIDIEATSKEILTWIINNVEQFIDNQKRMFKLDLIIDAEDGATESLPLTKKLQDLYRAVPEDDDKIDVKGVINPPLEFSEETLAEMNSESLQNGGELSEKAQKEIVGRMESVDDGSLLKNLSKEQLAKMDELSECRNILDKVTSSIFQLMKEDNELLKTLFKRMSYYYEMKGVSKGELLLQEVDGEVAILKFEYEAFTVKVNVGGTKVPVKQLDGTIVEKKASIAKSYEIPEGFSIWLEVAIKPKKKQMPSLF